MSLRDNSFLYISAFALEERELPVAYLPDDPEVLKAQILDLSLVAASLLRCWAKEAGIPHQVLLCDLAVGQAQEEDPISPIKE